LLAGGVGSVMGDRRTVGERRCCCDGIESDEDKNCFHEHSPDLRWPSWLTTEAMTAVHGLFFPAAVRRAPAPTHDQLVILTLE
jgi:hypothetical protein